MSDAFKKHGIDHLSPSSLNLFAAAPAVWVMERLLNRKAPVGCAAHRGTAVEAGIIHGLDGASDEDAVTLAERVFGEKAALSGDPNREKERAAIAPMVVTGLAEMRPYGKPSRTQEMVRWKVDGVSVPVIGYYDAIWDDHGVVIDFKSTHRLPSQISTSHARQVALYKAALGDNLDARITYVTPKKAATYRLENAREHVVALERIARTLGRFLSVSDDPKELASIIIPDVDSFYLAAPEARRAAFEVFGI